MSRASARILRAGGPVDLDRYARRVGSRVNQVKRNVRAGVGNSRMPLADAYVDEMTRVISSTRSFVSSHRIRAPLPSTCSSPADSAFISPMAAAKSPEGTVVFAHCGSAIVVDARYPVGRLGRVRVVHCRSGTSTPRWPPR